ncbi:MAG: hypothetical protein NVSMB5_23990 [Candidatus Velthaea sp.]
MFGTPQDIIAILTGAALIFGGGGAAVRSQFGKPGGDAAPAPEHPAERERGESEQAPFSP